MPSDLNTLIGEIVRLMRRGKNLSMQDICDQLGSKITPQQLALYETGKSRWPVDLLVDVATVLNTDIRVLLGQIK